MMSVVSFIGGLGPMEIGGWLSLLIILAFLFWLIRRPVNTRINELEESFENRLDDLEERIEQLE